MKPDRVAASALTERQKRRKVSVKGDAHCANTGRYLYAWNFLRYAAARGPVPLCRVRLSFWLPPPATPALPFLLG